jgi:hypothetical protein
LQARAYHAGGIRSISSGARTASAPLSSRVGQFVLKYFLLRVIRFLRGLFAQQVVTDAQHDMNAHFFVRSGYEYYANARFAMHTNSSYVCGNLFHHAIEMLLKADLAKNRKSLEELERMKHNLKRLWRAYAALSRHDRTINSLNRHEEIRYPDPALGSMA